MSNINTDDLNKLDLQNEIDHWELFQLETDDTRNLILDYLVKKCEIHSPKNYKCPNLFENLDIPNEKIFHFEICNKFLFQTEKRRKPFINGKLLYNQNICIEFEINSKCSKGDMCDFSHNQLEIKFHPWNYRKDLCKIPDCEKMKKYCFKSHRSQDLRNFSFIKNNIKIISSENKYENTKDYNFYSNNNDEIFEYKGKHEKNQKDNMLNQLNLDIKNLLDEFDLDQINCENLENENIENTDYKTNKKFSDNFNDISPKSTNSANSKILEGYEGEIFLNINDNSINTSNSASSVRNLKLNLQSIPNNNYTNKMFIPNNLRNKEIFADINNFNINPLDISPTCGNNRSNPDKEFFQKFDLLTFKTIKCNILTKHNEKHCVFFHSNKDRRRIIIKYSSDTCKFALSDKLCPDCDLCSFSHNKVEMFYHPDRFKTKFCSQFNIHDSPSKRNLLNCVYGKYCSFAHTEDEIKIELIHKYNYDEDFFINYFKTVVCPFTHDHDKATCVYSHNWQDYRRNPKKYTYRNTPCQIWDIKKTILNYRDGCPRESSCLMCHGWKEEDFHPLNYKTKKCKNFNKNCEKTIYCPFFHTLEEKRKIPLRIKQEYETRLDNKMIENKYSNILDNSFNMNRSNSVKSNLSDNVSYNNQNRRPNFNFYNNNNQNIQNISQMNEIKINNNNINNNNFMGKNNSNGNFMGNPGYNSQLNNSYNMSPNYNNYNYMQNFINMNNNFNNLQLENLKMNIPQHKYSYNSVNNNLINNKNQNKFMNNNVNNNNNNIWSTSNQFNNQKCYSANNSVGKRSFTENDLYENQNNNFSYPSISSHLSNSSSDLNESFKNEKDYEMILGNPDDDSLDINELENQDNLNDLNIDNDRKYGKNDNYYLQTIEESNNYLKDLIKEADNIEFNNEKSRNLKNNNSNKNNFLDFLRENNFKNLFNLIQNNQLLLVDLVKFSDQKIYELIEPENRHKSNKLINLLMKYEERIEGDYVMKSLNNLNFHQ